MKRLILTAVILSALMTAFTGCAADKETEKAINSTADSTVVEEIAEKFDETKTETTENEIVEENITEESNTETTAENKEEQKNEQAPITDNRIPVTEILTLNKTVEVGSVTPTVLSIMPENADYGLELTFVSDNENVAKVDNNGTVTAISAGTATVTVTSSNGVTATYTVTVTEKEYVYTETNKGGALGSGAVKEKDDTSYYPEGSILYGMTKEEIIAAYPEPAYGAVSFENENAKTPWYWQHVTVTYTWDGDTCIQDLIFGGGSNQEEIMKYAEPMYPWPENGEEKSATIWVYLGDGLV